MPDKEELTMREIADAYINNDPDALKAYREHIALMANGYVERVDAMNTPLFTCICMAMSIAYTKAMIDAGMLSDEQMREYNQKEEDRVTAIFKSKEEEARKNDMN